MVIFSSHTNMQFSILNEFFRLELQGRWYTTGDIKRIKLVISTWIFMGFSPIDRVILPKNYDISFVKGLCELVGI